MSKQPKGIWFQEPAQSPTPTQALNAGTLPTQGLQDATIYLVTHLYLMFLHFNHNLWYQLHFAKGHRDR
jgi:hypothetical protein